MRLSDCVCDLSVCGLSVVCVLCFDCGLGFDDWLGCWWLLVCGLLLDVV